VTTINEDQAEQLKAEAIASRRAARPAWQNAHADRINREREARETAKEYRRAQWQAELVAQKQCSSCAQTLPLTSFGIARGKPRARCTACHNEVNRRLYYTRQGRSEIGAERGSVSPERQRKAAERIAHLTALLMGTSPGERIASEEGWDMATSELQSLWLQSGHKECVFCRAVVPPSAMLPPGPANFYPGHCRKCARQAYETETIRVFGKVSQPRLLPMRDGTSITLGEFARRHRERGQARRLK
jgi:hypothetical protein